MKLYIDFETWSAVPIRRGTDVYMDNAKPLLCTYAVEDGPVQVVDFTLGEQLPPFHTQLEFWAHNAFFDSMVLRKLLGLEVPIDSWRCSAANALLHGLPGGLEALCDALKVPTDIAKIKDGKRLIQKFCCKKEFVKDEEWPLFIQYAVNDITAMRECIKRMPSWNYKGTELELWHVDQIINNRGFQIDRQLAENTVKSLTRERGKHDDATALATGGAVGAATQRDKLLTYICEEQGVFLPDLKATSVKEALDDPNLPEAVRALLNIRVKASKTSGAKYKRVLECAGKGDRLRGTLQYAGAARTARWAGRMFQPQNLPRPTMQVSDKDGSNPNCEIRHCIEFLREEKPELVALFAGVNEAALNALRGVIIAAPGCELLAADYSSIEGRVNAWLAGEAWKVKAFREGKDLYKMIYANGFGMDVTAVTKAQRQIGKVMELALGYGGGVGAFLSMAAGYGMDLEEMSRMVTPAPKALDAWEKALAAGTDYGLTKEVYIACDTLKIGYRKGNPAITQSWYQYEDAVRKVIDAKDPKLQLQVGRIMFDCNGAWLRIKLPSGRFLCYASPSITSNGTITYYGWQNKQWRRTKTYGGKICENIVQAISRDLLGEAIVRLEKIGFPVVLHVHDEIVAEKEIGSSSLSFFIQKMSENPTWAAGLPLKAEGFKGVRYEK